MAALAHLLGSRAALLGPRLAAYFGSAKEAFEASFEQVKASGILTEKGAQHYRKWYDPGLPQKIADYCEIAHISLLGIQESGYPASLREIADPPWVLYVKGKLPNLTAYLAVVGSRKATGYGLSIAERFSRVLASEKIAIVSGGAYGIDAAAHEGALLGGGKTISVLGSGLARPYPVRHKGLFQRISETGAVISEFSPFTPPMAYQFPMRNRIIVGLSSGVLVVEAALKSGAMITAHLAADEGRDVYAVPGPIESFTSKGTHALIKEGAHLVDDPQDLLDVYFPEDVPKGAHAVELSLFETFPVPDRKKAEALYDFIKGGNGKQMEEIMAHFPWPLSFVSMLLLRMEVAGMVRKSAGNRYLIS